MSKALRIRNATVWNGGDALEKYESLYIVDGKFVGLGEVDTHVVGRDGSGKLEDTHILGMGAGVDAHAAMGLDTHVEEIDATGLIILPGLINAHVHFCLDGSASSVANLMNEAHLMTAYKACAAAEATLRSGTTTVRDVGCNGGIGIYLKKAIENGFVKGPRMMASGPCIVMTGGHNRFIGTEVDGVDEARKAARHNIKLGADLIKVVATGGVITPGVEPENVQLSMEEMRAAVDEAHNCGKHAASHAQGEQGIRNSLQAGVNTIEHGIYLTPDLIDAMLNHQAALVPTLTPMRRILEARPDAHIPDYAVEKMRRVADKWVESFVTAADAGVPIVAGTDAGTPGNPHGSVAVEVKFMVGAGLSPAAALRSATTAAAKAIGLEDEVGRIAPNLWADLIFLKSNPLDDINALDTLCGVMKAGKFVWFEGETERKREMERTPTRAKEEVKEGAKEGTPTLS